jgi:hypothetical protein
MKLEQMYEMKKYRRNKKKGAVRKKEKVEQSKKELRGKMLKGRWTMEVSYP